MYCVVYSVAISLQDKMASTTWEAWRKLIHTKRKSDQEFVNHDGVFKECTQEKNVKSQRGHIKRPQSFGKGLKGSSLLPTISRMISRKKVPDNNGSSLEWTRDKDKDKLPLCLYYLSFV